MTLAPIVLFVYNRPQHTLRTLEALANNRLAKESILYIYADGPKDGADRTTIEKIEETRAILRQHQWCGEIHIIESEKNKGLANSIVEGVTQIVEEYGSVIVLEDDIVTSPLFLTYMNEALKFYEKEMKVMHVSGYTPVTTGQHKLPDTFLLHLSNCWGWATWKDRWNLFNPNAQSLLEDISEKINLKRFTLDYNYDIYIQLEKNITKELNTWFVKWYSSIYLNGGFSLFPKYSLVENIGMDGTGEHCICLDDRYNVEFADSIRIAPILIQENEYAWNYFRRFYKYGTDSTFRRQFINYIRSTRFFAFIKRLSVYRLYTKLRYK